MKKFRRLQTLKGFRDFLPEEALKRQYLLEIIRKTFELYGFVPIETPALEYLEVFSGNIGEGEKLFYQFKDRGGRKVALRYDQTVPTCRFLAQHFEKITFPFKRYQIQTVWRAENPQKGRYREFLQCDADIFGAKDYVADAEVIALSIEVFKNLGFKKPLALINDRQLYQDLPYPVVIALDKLTKEGEEKVIQELGRQGYSKTKAQTLLSQIKNQKPNLRLKNIFQFLKNYQLAENFRFQPTLARAFSYSSGVIWEIIVEGFSGGSLAGGERYDHLFSRFFPQSLSGTGFAIGFDRTIIALQEADLLPKLKTKTQVLVTVLDKRFLPFLQKLAQKLRKEGIPTDFYPKLEEKIEKQIKYADKNGIPFVIFLGEEEVKKNLITLKNLKTGKQETLSFSQLLGRLCQKKNP